MWQMPRSSIWIFSEEKGWFTFSLCQNSEHAWRRSRGTCHLYRRLPLRDATSNVEGCYFKPLSFVELWTDLSDFFTHQLVFQKPFSLMGSQLRQSQESRRITSPFGRRGNSDQYYYHDDSQESKKAAKPVWVRCKAWVDTWRNLIESCHCRNTEQVRVCHCIWNKLAYTQVNRSPYL